MTEIPHPVTDALAAVVVGAVSWFTSRSGTKKGMNGTAARVQNVEATQGKILGLLQGNIEATREDFKGLRDGFVNLTQRVGGVETALEQRGKMFDGIADQLTSISDVGESNSKAIKSLKRAAPKRRTRQ